MASSDLYIRIDGTSAGFDAAASTAQKAALRLEVSLKSAAVSQGLLNKAVAQYGAGSAEVVAASKAYDASLLRVAKANEVAAIASKRATETMARDNAARAASAEAASAKQAAALRKMGTVYGKVGLVAAAGLALAAKAAADFDSKIAQVQSLAKDASDAQIAQLRDASTQYANIGISATQAADAEIELVKAGISVDDMLGGALTGTLNLAAAGQTDVATATEIAAQAMTQFQLAGKDIPHLADLLAAGADKALGSVTDLGEGLQYSGLTAHQLGLSVDETVGTLAEFAQAGLIGSQGGAAFQQMLLKLENPTIKGSGLMNDLGLSLYNAQGNFVGVTELAGQLHDKLGDLTQEQRLSTLATLFGSRAVRAANVLYQDGAKGAAAWQAKVEDSGFAAEQAAGKMDSLTGDMQKLSAQVTNAAIALGEQLQGPLRTVTQDLTGFASIMEGLPDPVNKALALTLAFTAAVGAGVFVYSRAKLALASMATTMGVVGTRTADATLKQRLFNQNSALMRAGAATLGIALLTLHSDADKVNTGLGILTQTAGSAALGFSVGGPWGAALGGGVGLLTAYWSELGKVSDALQRVQTLSSSDPFNFAAVKTAADATTQSLGSSATQTGFLASALDGIPGIGTAAGDALHYFSDSARDASEQSGILAAQSLVLKDNVELFAHDFLDVPLDAPFRVMNVAIAQTIPKLEALGFTLPRIQKLMGSSAGQQVLADALDKAAASAEKLPQPIDDARTAAEKLSDATQKLTDKLLRLDSVALDQRATMRDWQASIDETTASLKDNGKTLDITTEKGRNNAASLDAMAQSALTVADGIVNMGTKTKFIDTARDALLKQAEAFGMTEKGAQRYVDRVLRDLDPALDGASGKTDNLSGKLDHLGEQKPTPKIQVDTADGLRSLQDFVAKTNTALGSIQDEPVNITLSAQATKVASQLGQTLAAGGPVHGPGGPKDDKVPIWASNGEYVLPADEVTKAGGVPVIEAIRRMIKRGELHRYGDIPAFASGGPVVSVRPDVQSIGLSASVAEVQRMFDGIVAGIGAAMSKQASDHYTNLPTQGQLGPGGNLTPAQVARGQVFAQAQVGKPYLWGGVGPSGYDCTGFPSAILNAALGMYPYSRRGATSSAPWPGSSPGYGIDTIGWTTNWEGSGIGHATSNIGGLNAESYGGHGPAVGSGARSPTDSHFYGHMHYDQGGRWPNNTVGVNTSGHDETVLPYPPEAIARAMKSAGGFMGQGRAAPQIVVQAPSGPFRVRFDVGGQTLSGVMESIADNAVMQHASHGSTLAGMNA